MRFWPGSSVVGSRCMLQSVIRPCCAHRDDVRRDVHEQAQSNVLFTICLCAAGEQGPAEPQALTIRLLGHGCTRCSFVQNLLFDLKRRHGVGVDARSWVLRFGRRRCFAGQGGSAKAVAAAHAWLSSQPRSNTRQAANCIVATAAFDCGHTCGGARHGLRPFRPSRPPQSASPARLRESRMHVGCCRGVSCHCRRSSACALSPLPSTPATSREFAWLPASGVDMCHALLPACDPAGCATDGSVPRAAQVDLPVHPELPAALYRLQDAAAPIDLPPRHRVDVRMLDNRELDKLVGALGRNKVGSSVFPAVAVAEERLLCHCHHPRPGSTRQHAVEAERRVSVRRLTVRPVCCFAGNLAKGAGAA